MATPNTPNTNINTTLSRKVSRAVKATHKACWYNASTALLKRAGGLPEGTVYVEGWVATALGDAPGAPYFPVEHGWLETPDGAVVDPTLPLTQSDASLALNHYFAGARYDLPTLLTRTQAHATLPLVYEGNGFGGFRNPEYLAAHQACLAFCTGQP